MNKKEINETLKFLKGLVESGDLKLTSRLKETSEEYISIATLTYKGKKVDMKTDSKVKRGVI